MLLCLPPEETPMCTPTARDGYERLSFAGQTLPPGFPSPFLFPDGLSSIETLLTNIQVRDLSVRRYLTEGEISTYLIQFSLVDSDGLLTTN